MQIRGDRETVRALQELSKGVPLAAVDKAARDSLKPMQDTARANARRNRNYVGKWSGFFPQPKPGRDFVDKGIVTRKVAGNRTRRTFWLGATRRARKILHLLEFGTAPHWQPNFRGGWFHPGAKPRPTIVPAFEKHADGVITGFGQGLWAALERKIVAVRKRRR